MAFSGTTFTKLYNWLTDPQRNEKIFNSRLDDEFGGIATGLTSTAVSVSTLNTTVTALSATVTALSATVNTAASPFYVNRNGSAQTIGSGAFTKIQFTNKVFDPQSAFDAVTNFRYQPQVAGKYVFAASAFISNTAAGPSLIMSFFKNGSEIFRVLQAVVNTSWLPNGSTIIDLNGSSDYVELFAFQNSGVNQQIGLAASDPVLWMSGARLCT